MNPAKTVLPSQVAEVCLRPGNDALIASASLSAAVTIWDQSPLPCPGRDPLILSLLKASRANERLGRS